MAEFRLSPTAQRDLDAIFDYTATTWGLAQALRYTDLIEAACANLAAAPYQAPGCAHTRRDYRRRATERHMIYFTPTDYGIAVIRILNQRMDPLRRL